MAAPQSRASHRVVVALLDGRRERGFVYTFRPDAGNFYLFPTESADARHASLVEITGVKAIFFVRTHEGDKARREAMRKAPPDPRKSRVRGHKMRITFKDGEEMFASAENYNPARLGFFVYPLDQGSNNLRIFVVNENVGQVTTAGAPGDGRASPQERLLKVPAREPCAVPIESRMEAVLRTVAGEAAESVAGDAGVPAGVVALWTRVFLEAGKAGLAGGADGRGDLIKELEARIVTLEGELQRLRRVGGGKP